jgi:hypothetical protein
MRLLRSADVNEFLAMNREYLKIVKPDGRETLLSSQDVYDLMDMSKAKYRIFEDRKIGKRCPKLTFMRCRREEGSLRKSVKLQFIFANAFHRDSGFQDTRMELC